MIDPDVEIDQRYPGQFVLRTRTGAEILLDDPDDIAEARAELHRRQQSRPFQEDGHLAVPDARSIEWYEADRARLLSVIRRLIEDDEWRFSLRNGLRADDLLLAAIDLGIET